MHHFVAPLVDRLMSIAQWHKAEEPLQKLQGSSVQIEFSEPQCSLYFTFTDRPHCSSEPADNQAIDVLLKMTWVNAALLSVDSTRKKIHIEGDTETALNFQNVLNSASTDLEELAAAHLPPTVAFPVQKILKKISAFGEATFENLVTQGHHILVQEGQYTPAKQELQKFLTDVDQLRLDTDRLIKILQSKGKT